MSRLLKRKYSHQAHRVLAKCASVFLVSAVICGLYFGLHVMRISGFTPKLVYQLIFNAGDVLRSTNNRTNVLLLGIGGGDHAGSDLTDTMMVLSVDIHKKSVALVSIPRDIWSDTLKDKVNTAYHYGNEKKKGGGLTLAKVVAEDITGLVIPYSVRIDFSGFKDIVDVVGGVDVSVSAAFTDTEYPIPGKEHDTCPGDPTNRCVYETVHFDAGPQHMDGNRALIYVRSRHADGQEGSDFARNRRQQEVVIALKNIIIHPASWISVMRLQRLRALYHEVIETDMKTAELAAIGSRFISTDESHTQKIQIDPLFEEPSAYEFSGRFVLVPKTDWTTIHEYIALSLGR